MLHEPTYSHLFRNKGILIQLSNVPSHWDTHLNFSVDKFKSFPSLYSPRLNNFRIGTRENDHENCPFPRGAITQLRQPPYRRRYNEDNNTLLSPVTNFPIPPLKIIRFDSSFSFPSCHTTWHWRKGWVGCRINVHFRKTRRWNGTAFDMASFPLR